MVKMTSEIGRILKCLTSKSYHSLQDDAYTHVQLIPRAEVTDLQHHHPIPIDEALSERIGSSSKIRRPRSAGDITETLHGCNGTVGLETLAAISTFPGGHNGQGPEVRDVVSSSAFSRPSTLSQNGVVVGVGGSGSSSSEGGVATTQVLANGGSISPSSNSSNNVHGPSSGSSSASSSSSGGILSFFGMKFKSNTRHLERSAHQASNLVECGKSCQNNISSGNNSGSGSNNNNYSSHNNNKQNDQDLRYTKFPLPYGKGPSQRVNNNGVGNSENGTGGLSNTNGNNRLSDASSSSLSPSSSGTSQSSSSKSRNKSKLLSLDSSQPYNHHHNQQQHQIQPDLGSSGDASTISSTSNNPSDSSSSAGGVVVNSTIPPNQPFEESQIHFTPQTRTYAHPHRSPLPVTKSNGSSSSGNFLTNTVSSIGRKVVNSVTPGSRSKHNKSKLKVKSKSDNSLHRVNVNNVNVNSVLAACASGSGGGGVPRNSSATTFDNHFNHHHRDRESSSSFDAGDPSAERRLNSVQLGDHATIRLPWTGFQQINNLSSVSTSARTNIPNTHNNNFDFASLSSSGNNSSLVSNSSERYVECGAGANSQLRRAPLPASNCGPRSGGAGTSRAIVTRRRSRSLERCSNFRVIPITSSNNTGNNCGSNVNTQGSFPSWGSDLGGSILSRSHSRKETGSEKEKQRTRSAHSLERNLGHKVRQLTPTEQEILLRNIDWNNPHPQPPRRPDKPGKNSSSIFHGSATSSSSTSTLASFKSSGRVVQHRSSGPFEKLHRSAPNSSFSNSSESGESSYSAPPSPPPRPASTLKPDSRLIIHTSSPCSRKGHHPVNSMLNSIPKRRVVVPPRSHGSSSDSSVSLMSSLRGTSDFSDESAGSVNIISQQNALAMNHHHHRPTTTSSSSAGGAFSTVTAAAAAASPSSVNMTTTNSTAPAGISLEDVRNSGFINKPSKGWLHSDQMLSKEGVIYTVRYIGCLDVNTSMKSLDFDTRSLIAKECINQVCEAAGLRSQDKKRKVDRRVARILGMRPRLDHAGSDVRLTITSTCLKLTSLDTGAVIAVHDMPNISFASGGDATMLDFVAYVAKDAIVGRACFVLECGTGLAQDVITTVGQAFELRFKEYLQKRPPPPRVPMDDPEYYNDLPGKVPPDISVTAAAAGDKEKGSSQSQGQNGKGKNGNSRAKEPPPLNLHSANSEKELSVNLIDFEAPTPPAFGPSVEDKQLDSFLLPGSEQGCGANNLGASGGHHHNHHQNSVGTGLGLPNSPSQPQQPKDPFDMQPFNATLPQSLPASVVEDQRRLLEGEIWFHGTVSRSEAEELLKQDGDFLVRESMACPGQFVLTGLQGGSAKHLLLVDPEGVVRTKDRTFDNVIHLVKYHSDNCLPIISAESMVILRSPVPRVISSS